MAILVTLNEGSEETRQKRAVRRHLNKKKDQRPDRQDESVQVDESVVVGSIPHMEHAVHSHHVHGIDSPDYHIHRIEKINMSGNEGHVLHNYLVVHKKEISSPSGERRPVHHVNVSSMPNHSNPFVVTHMKQVYL